MHGWIHIENDRITASHHIWSTLSPRFYKTHSLSKHTVRVTKPFFMKETCIRSRNSKSYFLVTIVRNSSTRNCNEPKWSWAS